MSLFFLKSGVVHVRLPGGIRLATLTAGMAFGEMALLETPHTADVLADKSVTALEVPLRDFQRFREQHPRTGERIMHNLAQLLADRLVIEKRRHGFWIFTLGFVVGAIVLFALALFAALRST